MIIKTKQKPIPPIILLLTVNSKSGSYRSFFFVFKQRGEIKGTGMISMTEAKGGAVMEAQQTRSITRAASCAAPLAGHAG